jgi:uncharacterized protein (TIGR03086 family)
MNSSAARYAASAAKLSALLAQVPADGWSRPTPCEGWSVTDVVHHIVTTEADFMAKRGLAVAGLDGLAPSDAWPIVSTAVQVALDDPVVAATEYDSHFGPSTIAASLGRFYTMDLIVHRWDIAVACGLAEHAALTSEELASVRTDLVGIEGAMRSPGLFGPEVPVGPDADEQTRLLAYIGRSAP